MLFEVKVFDEDARYKGLITEKDGGYKFVPSEVHSYTKDEMAQVYFVIEALENAKENGGLK